MHVTIVVAMTPSRLIGKAGGLPWHLPEDLQHFKRVTLGHTIIMGRKTLDEIKKPLPGRRNMVITRQTNLPLRAGIEWFPALEPALGAARAGGETDCMIIGGAEIFRAALAANLVDRMVITYVHITPEPQGDTHFPEWDQSQWNQADRREITTADGKARMEFVRYERIAN